MDERDEVQVYRHSGGVYDDTPLFVKLFFGGVGVLSFILALVMLVVGVKLAFLI